MIRLFTDMIGRTIQLDHPPMRIVSLVPSQTELLYDLGLSDEVAGITKFCVHPHDWFRHKRRVGGTKQVDLELVRSLRPDLILANKEENEREQIEQLAASCPMWVSDIKTLADAFVMIRNIGVMTGMMNNAMAIEKDIKAGFAELTKSRLPLKVLYLIWRGPYMAAGGDTFIHDMITRIGWENVLSKTNRYPNITDADIVTLNPDLILLSSEPYPFKENHIHELEAVVPRAKIVLVDGEMFSWYGSRIVKATQYFGGLAKQVAHLYQ